MEFLNGTEVDFDNRELIPEIERLELGRMLTSEACCDVRF